MDAVGTRTLAAAAVTALACVLFVPFVRGQRADRQNQRAVTERWEWEGRDLGLVLRAAFARQHALMAVTAAGCLPYWSELPSLDMLGLNDYYLPRHPPPDLGSGILGHELGDGAYVLSRHPDLIVFNVGTPPQYRSGEELDRMPAFHQRYVPVAIALESAPQPPVVYVDKLSAKIGLIASDTTLTVPAFLLTGPDVVAHLDAQNTLVIRIARGQVARVELPTPRGERWDVEVAASDPRGVAATVSSGADAFVLTVRGTGDTPVDVERIVLRRADR